VNYTRGLQGRWYCVATGPVGLPGEMVDKLPGYSQIIDTTPRADVHKHASTAG
jgi:hypothetical protein